MSESLEQGIMECPVCKEGSLVPANCVLLAREGGKEKELPVLACEACGGSVAIDNDTVFILPVIYSVKLNT